MEERTSWGPAGDEGGGSVAIITLDRALPGGEKNALQLEVPDAVALGGTDWSVVAAVQHRGSSALAGHYVAMVRTGADVYRIADDSSISAGMGLAEAWGAIGAEPSIVFCVRNGATTYAGAQPVPGGGAATHIYGAEKSSDAATLAAKATGQHGRPVSVRGMSTESPASSLPPT